MYDPVLQHLIVGGERPVKTCCHLWDYQQVALLKDGAIFLSGVATGKLLLLQLVTPTYTGSRKSN